MNIKKIRKHCSALFEPRTFAVDISSKDIKIFQIKKRRGKHKIIGWSKKELPDGVLDGFEVKDKDKFVRLIKDALSADTARKIKGNSVILSIPEDKIFLRTISIPIMSEKEISETIKWEVEQNLPISIDEVYFDWQIVARKRSELKVLVAASPRAVIDSFVEALGCAGFYTSVLEADSMATGRSLLSYKITDPVLVVDIGIEGTGYFIYHDNYPIFSSGGSVSGHMFTDSVSKYYELGWNKAEHRKTKIGLGSNQKEREEALRLYAPLLTTLVQEIEKTIIFYNESLGGEKKRKIQEVILCGGGSNLKGLVPYLAIHLKRKVIQSDPWKNIKLDKGIPLISKEEAQSYVTAIGLAIRN